MKVSRLLLNPAVHMVFLSVLIAFMFLWIPYVSAYVVDALNSKELYATIVIGEVARSMIWWLPVCVIFPFVQNAIKILAQFATATIACHLLFLPASAATAAGSSDR